MSDRPALVVFAVDPRSKESVAMADAVRAHLTGLPVRLVTEMPAGGTDTPGASQLLGTLTIDPGSPGEWVVSFTEPSIETTLVRRLRLKPQAKGVALEEAAIVVRSMVEAILDGGHVGIVKEPEPEEDDRRTERPRSRAPRRAFAGTFGYVGTTFARGLGWQSGALVGLRWQSSEVYVGGAYAIYPALQSDTPPASIELSRHPGSIVVGYEANSVVSPLVELQLSADYVQRTVRGVETGFVPTEDVGRWSFLLGAELGLAWAFAPRFRATARGGADWMINRYSYSIPGVGDVATPSAVRPKLELCLGVDLF